MYSTRPGLILGFHGCDEDLGMDILCDRKQFKSQKNNWDWLGNGAYFWEYSYERALEWAEEESKKLKSKIKKPFVLGAVLNLGFCFDLLDFRNLQLLKAYYGAFVEVNENAGEPIPVNRQPINTKGNDNLIRELDCSVFEFAHEVRLRDNQQAFDSIRGMFLEGNPIYPNAGFNEMNHIQICIRNPNCIKGFFLPREIDGKWPKV